jgi:hypothetical protein
VCPSTKCAICSLLFTAIYRYAVELKECKASLANDPTNLRHRQTNEVARANAKVKVKYRTHCFWLVATELITPHSEILWCYGAMVMIISNELLVITFLYFHTFSYLNIQYVFVSKFHIIFSIRCNSTFHNYVSYSLPSHEVLDGAPSPLGEIQRGHADV